MSPYGRNGSNEAVIVRLGSCNRGKALVTVAVALMLVSIAGIGMAATPYSVQSYWSTQTFSPVPSIKLTVSWTSAIHIFGAVDGLPLRVPMTVKSSLSSTDSFVMKQMTLRGVTPLDAEAEVLDDGLPWNGMVLSPSESLSWNVTIVPHFGSKYPMQVAMSVDCLFGKARFQLGTNFILRKPGPSDTQPLVLSNVPSAYAPALGSQIWGGVTYHYAVLAKYPFSNGLSSFYADLVIHIGMQSSVGDDDILVVRTLSGGSEFPVSLTYSGSIATGSVPINSGILVDPGYSEVFDFGFTFSASVPAQDIVLQFYAEMV